MAHSGDRHSCTPRGLRPRWWLIPWTERLLPLLWQSTRGRCIAGSETKALLKPLAPWPLGRTPSRRHWVAASKGSARDGRGSAIASASGVENGGSFGVCSFQTVDDNNSRELMSGTASEPSVVSQTSKIGWEPNRNAISPLTGNPYRLLQNEKQPRRGDIEQRTKADSTLEPTTCFPRLFCRSTATVEQSLWTAVALLS